MHRIWRLPSVPRLFARQLLLSIGFLAISTATRSEHVSRPRPPRLIPHQSQGAVFNREVEFPNYFLPQDFAQRPAAEQSRIANQRKKELEAAMSSVFDRLMVPVAQPGTVDLKNVRYFDYVDEAVRKINPRAQVLPSGGVVRSVLGYLYEEMRDFSKAHPDKDPLERLRALAQEARDIEAIEVRGVGGDFDVLLNCPPEDFEKIKAEVLRITNSAEEALGASQDQSQSIKRMLFTVGDAKAYQEQTQRSTSQGGSTLDFLAYDRKSKKFIEPAGHNYILDDLLRGLYRYLPPEAGQTSEDFQKQAIRGLRALIELPFIELKDSSQFEAELQKLIEELKAKKTLNKKALEQIGKALRNGRSSMGNNRIVRASNKVETLIRDLSHELKKQNLEHIPEFVDSTSIDHRNPSLKKELNGFPKDLLTPIDEFIEKRSSNGILRHGTPTLDNAMAMMRGGLFYSGGFYNQGAAAEGGGGYTSSTKGGPLKEFSDGLVLELKIKKDARVNALEWSPKVDTWVRENRLEQKARAMSMDLHQYLQRFHGIDLIAKSAVMIQNMEALVLGSPKKRLVNILQSLRAGDAKDLLKFTKLRSYARGLGFQVQDVDTQTWVKALSQLSSNNDIFEVAQEGAEIWKTHPKVKAAFRPIYVRAIESFRKGSVYELRLFESLRSSARVHGFHIRGLSAEDWISALRKTNADEDIVWFAKEGTDVFKAHPSVKSALKETFSRRIARAAESESPLRDLAWIGHSESESLFSLFPDLASDYERKVKLALISAVKNDYIEEVKALIGSQHLLKKYPQILTLVIRQAKDMKRYYRGIMGGTEVPLNSLAQETYVFYDNPKGLIQFIKASARWEESGLPELAKHGQGLFEKYPETLREFIRSARTLESNGLLAPHSLVALAKYGEPFFKKNPHELEFFVDQMNSRRTTSGVYLHSYIDKFLDGIVLHNEETLKANPEILLKAMQHTLPYRAGQLLGKDPQFAERFYRDYLTKGLEGKKVLVRLKNERRDWARIPVIDNAVEKAGSDIPDNIKAIPDQRAARRALSAAPATLGTSKTPCVNLFRALYLKNRK